MTQATQTYQDPYSPIIYILKGNYAKSKKLTEWSLKAIILCKEPLWLNGGVQLDCEKA